MHAHASSNQLTIYHFISTRDFDTERNVEEV